MEMHLHVDDRNWTMYLFDKRLSRGIQIIANAFVDSIKKTKLLLMLFREFCMLCVFLSSRVHSEIANNRSEGIDSSKNISFITNNYYKSKSSWRQTPWGRPPLPPRETALEEDPPLRGRPPPRVDWMTHAYENITFLCGR